MSEKKVIELNEKEKQDVVIYQNTINQELYNLGSLRRQHKITETQILEKINQVESELMNKLKFMFQNKDVGEDMEGWVFDPAEFKFIKMGE